MTIANGADVVMGTLGDTQAAGTVVGDLNSIYSLLSSNSLGVVASQGSAGSTAWVTTLLDSGGVNITDATNHWLNVAVKSSVGVAAGTAIASITYAPVSANSVTVCNAGSLTNAQNNPLAMDLKQSLCVDLASILGTAIVSGGVAGSFGVGGLAASGVAVAGNPLLTGGRAATTSPTAVTDGQAVAWMMTPEGKGVIVPWAPEALRLRGANSATTTAATTFTGMGAQGASIKIYVVAVQCFRTDAGATMSYVTLNDGASTTVPLPPTGGAAPPYSGVPLVVAANTAFQFTPHDALTTVFCNAQGYSGP